MRIRSESYGSVSRLHLLVVLEAIRYSHRVFDPGFFTGMGLNLLRRACLFTLFAYTHAFVRKQSHLALIQEWQLPFTRTNRNRFRSLGLDLFAVHSRAISAKSTYARYVIHTCVRFFPFFCSFHCHPRRLFCATCRENLSTATQA